MSERAVIPRLTLPHRRRLSPLPAFARVPQATVRLLLESKWLHILLPTAVDLTNNSSGDAGLKTAAALLRWWRPVGRGFPLHTLSQRLGWSPQLSS